MALALPNSRFVGGPSIRTCRGPRQLGRPRALPRSLAEVEEGYRQLAAGLKKGLPGCMQTLRRDPAARRLLISLLAALLVLGSWAPVATLLYCAFQESPESIWQGLQVLEKDLDGNEQMYFLSFFLDKLPFIPSPPIASVQAMAPALFGNVLTGSVYAALADTAAASLFFFAGKSGLRRDFSKVRVFSGRRPQDGGARPFVDTAQRLADEEGLRLSLLLRLLPLPGPVDAALCLALGGLQARPAQFAAGHLAASWRYSLEYACLGTLGTEKVQADVLIVLQLLLAALSATVITTWGTQILDQLVNRTAARFAPSWPSVEPVQVLSSLPKVPLEALLSPPVEPCLVMDFLVPFPLRSLEDLRSAVYPCAEHPALMMYSPSGVFSSYPIDREVLQHGEGLRFADGSEERPAHVHRMEAFHEAVAHMTQESECDIQFSHGRSPTKYFRQGFPKRQREEALRLIGLVPEKFSDFSTYCSDRNSLTNFHFDQHPGCLQMCSGRKQVLLVHPSFSGYMQSLVEDRRSWITSEVQALTVPHWNVTLNAGDCLFIPKGFWHQVKSLDSPTLGTVLRYK